MADLRAPDPGHPPAGVLEGQDQRALEVALGPLQLLGGEASPRDVPHLLSGDLQNIVGFGGGAPGVHGEEAGLGEHRVVAIDGICQPPLLPDLLEQPGRHPAAQRRVDHAERESLGILARESTRSERDVRLLGGAVLDQRGPGHRGNVPAGSNLGGLARRDLRAGVHVSFHQCTDLLVAEVAGSSDHEVRRPIQAIVEPLHLVARDRGDRLAGAEDRPPQGVAFP